MDQFVLYHLELLYKRITLQLLYRNSGFFCLISQDIKAPDVQNDIGRGYLP
jgi:hypothetical protein